MSSNSEVRKRLESATYPDLGSMMDGYARAAADVARRDFKQKLDFTAESIDALDDILVLVGESPELDVDFESRLWGSYLGEVLRQRYAGNWEMTQYPGGMVAVPAVDVRGSRLFPLMKVYRRLTASDLRKAARRYLVDRARTTIRVLPDESASAEEAAQ